MKVKEALYGKSNRKFVYSILVFIILLALVFFGHGCGKSGSSSGGTATTPNYNPPNNGTSVPSTPTPATTFNPFTNRSSFTLAFSSNDFCKHYAIDGNVQSISVTGGKASLVFSLSSGLNTFQVTCNGSDGKASDPYTLTLVKLNNPTINSTTTFTDTTSSVVSATFEKAISETIFASINGLAYIEVVPAGSYTTDNYSQMSTSANSTYDQFLSTGSNNLVFKTRDAAGNYSAESLHTFTAGSINPSGPRLSTSGISVVPISGIVGANFTVGNVCVANCAGISCTISDGVTQTTTNCTGSTIFKYLTAGVRQITVTISGTAGSNVYTKVIEVTPAAGSVCDFDRFCEPPGENITSCPYDCSTGGNTGGGYCGDGVCNNGETNLTCSTDCNSYSAYCGDGICNNGETYLSCPNDCSYYGTVCGNGVCETGECGFCPSDCGYSCSGSNVCGNGVCEYGEDQYSCSSDCGGTVTGNFAVQGSFPIAAGAVAITNDNIDLYVLLSNGGVIRYDTNGNPTSMNFSGRPEVPGSPASISVILGSGKLEITDTTWGKVYVYIINKVNNVLIFSTSYGTTGTNSDSKLKNPDKSACDPAGECWIIDRGNNTVKFLNNSGGLICSYAAVSQVGQSVATDNTGLGYVSNQVQDRVDVLSRNSDNTECLRLRSVGARGSTQQPLVNPDALAVNGQGSILAVSDEGNYQTSYFDPSLQTNIGVPIVYSSGIPAPLGVTVIGNTVYWLQNGYVITVSQN